MKQKLFHPWTKDARKAIDIQNSLRKKIVFEKINESSVRYVAGIDVSYDRDLKKTIAGVVVYDIKQKCVVEKEYAILKTDFPYIPGLLTFREGEATCIALEKLNVEPDCLMFDAQGYAHPRRMGLATHIGVLFDKCSIGCAKSRLTGRFDEHKDFSFLYDDTEIIGAVLRTKKNTKPIFISIGNRIDLSSAVQIVKRCLNNHRLPEPTRLAHILVTNLRNKGLTNVQDFRDHKGWLMNREELFVELKKKVKNKNLIKHMLAVEAAMRSLAKKTGEDEEKWGIAGLLHDIDYEQTKSDMNKHSLIGAEILQKMGLSEDIVYAVKVHNPVHNLPRKSKMDKALYAVDPLTGLIVACALIKPEKKISKIDTGFVMKKFREKGFAAGADRKQIRTCEELGFSLEEFVDIVLKAMQGISQDLGL
ncbi:MAG: endonuclease V [Deltaproteobacteria bacterium]|nr:endonuclease V [Deltaproteobacteria bacterium]